MYIFDNFIIESVIFLSIIISHLLANLKLISLPHAGEVTQLAYQYMVKSCDLCQEILSGATAERSLQSVVHCEKARRLQTEEGLGMLSHSSQST